MQNNQDDGRSVPDGLSSALPIEPVPVSPVPASIPSAAQFAIGKYGDGSGPIVCVSYDALSKFTPDDVCLDKGDLGDLWFAFPARVAGEVCAAIMASAQAIEAHRAETERLGAQHESAVPTGCAQPQGDPQ